LSIANSNLENLQKFVSNKDKLRENHPLRYLFWESTLRCNLSCLHCGSDCVKDNSTAHQELSVKRIKAELLLISKKYDPKTITFAIIGGEPLVRLDDIVEVGSYAADLGFFWGITTNGMLLDESAIS